MVAMSTPHEVPITASLPAQTATPRSARRRLWLILRIAVPLVLLAYLSSKVSLADLGRALRLVSAVNLCAVLLLVLFNLLLAAVRWRLTLRACGVTGRAPILELFRLHLIGAFYTTCVPGGVGGEVVRAFATRKLFGSRGLPAALAVTLLERAQGACGLLALVAVTFALFPLPGVPHVLLFSTLGLAAVAGAIGALVLAPRIAPHVPGAIGRVLASLPVIESYPLFGLALALSVVTQFMGVLMGHLVVVNLFANVSLAQSAVIIPLIFAAQYFPLTVGGAGVREVAFVTLYGLVGVPSHDALAASLVIWALQLISGAVGGLVQMLKPLELQP
jgi:uncharacterized membrane protein YbhN (UPF0104 family)